MTIASEITRINNNIAAAYTAASGKGATLPATQDSANLATCIGSIPSGGSTGKYQLGDIVKDDSNQEIGRVVGFFPYNGNLEYAVVCLNSNYRTMGEVLNTSVQVGGLSAYDNLDGANVWESPDSATYNTTKILDFCAYNSYTSTACTHCRNQSFTIDGITYYGQLPNLREVAMIAFMYSAIRGTSSVKKIWSSSQRSVQNWRLNIDGGFGTESKTGSLQICPVLEIPNNV